MTRSRRIKIGEEFRDIPLNEGERASAIHELPDGCFVVQLPTRSIEIFSKPNGNLPSGNLSDGNTIDDLEITLETERERIIRERFGTLLSGVAGAAESGPLTVRAPMPGLLRALKLKEGETVTKGATLLVLEAMKMENNIAAPNSGRIIKIHVAEGESVEKGAKLLEIERLAT
jgi:biotin carboxyl carrier protein